jgi:hypothetical protein
MTPYHRLIAHWDTFLSVTRKRWDRYVSLRDIRLKDEVRVGETEAKELFERVSEALKRILGGPFLPPRMVFFPAISRMKRKLVYLSLGLGMVVVALSLVVVYMVKMGVLSVTEGYYCAFPLLFLAPFPWTMYGRVREYMEQGSYYLSPEEVVIYDLYRSRFLSYCTHEVASYLLEHEGPSWEFYREGWARGVQYNVTEDLAEEGEEGVPLSSLQLMLGELRMALEWLSRRGKRDLPSWVEALPGPYSPSWWKGFLGINRVPTPDVVSRALSTAYFQVLEEKEGAEVYREYLEGKADERWPFVSANPQDWEETGD